MRPRVPNIPTTPEERRARELGNYWRIRLTTAVDALEREARRMLQLEEELGSFAMRYYDAVSDAVQKLDALEQQLPHLQSPDPVPEFKEMVTQCEARAARRSELKKRYRTLAKGIHPDRQMVVEGTGLGASSMHRLNSAYQKGDLAALLKLDAELMLVEICGEDFSQTALLESALYEIKRAADTYADGYRTLLGSSLNTLMLRAMSLRVNGVDWIDSVLRKIERSIDEKERALLIALTLFDEHQAPTQIM